MVDRAPVVAAGRRAWREVSSAPGLLAGVVFVLVSLFVLPGEARADRAFSVRYSANDTGNITMAAAPLLACSTTGTNGARCAAAQNLDASTAVAGVDNNSFTMANVDTDRDPATTVNSSTATLALPGGATVLFAGLYWGADISAGNNGGALPATGTAANRIKFKAPGGTYATLTATTTDFGTAISSTR